MKPCCALALLAVAAAGVCWLAERQVVGPPPTRMSPPGSSGVKLAPVEIRDLPEFLIRPGEVVAARRYELAPRLTGRLLELGVRPGDRVAAGERIAVVAAPELEQSLRQAQAGLEAARTEVADAQVDMRRLTALAKTQSIAEKALRDGQVRLDKGEAAVAAAQALVAARRVDLEELSLRAPEDLVILQRLREPGALTGPALPIVEVESSQERRFETWVPLRDSTDLHLGLPIEIYFPGQERPLLGQLNRLVDSVDAVTRSRKLEISLPPDTAILPGTYGEAHIRLGLKTRTLIPPGALLSRAGVSGVFVLDSEGRARFRSVRTGRQAAGQWEVLAGVTPGEQILVDPPSRLLDGSPVEVQPP